MNKKITSIIAAACLAVTAASCTTKADRASANLSKAADQFEVARRIVFLNGITDTYMLTIEGLCSIEDEGFQLEVTCKTGPNEFRKHFLGLSDNVSYFVEQVEGVNVSTTTYRVVFRPTTLLPSIEN